jgi:glucose-1-phosphate adenylyltransferase
MGGGRGTRLRPLTRDRAKPAVPLAGMYRLVDIPISNCLNSDINQIYLLTQFNSASLHRHIREAYKFDSFDGGFVEILAAEQSERGENWYQGTADAVRQNLIHLNCEDDDLVLILSGDQLYRMDYRTIVQQHRATGARVTVAATPVHESQASAFGLMRVGSDLGIAEFVEKPKDPAVLASLRVPPELRSRIPDPSGDGYCLASMGIYVFSAGVLKAALQNDDADFGREIIPSLRKDGGLFAFMFEGYWEDIGTVAAFFEANLRLTDAVPPFNFFDAEHPIYTRARYLPAAKVNRCDIDRAIIAPGTIITASRIERSVVGIRAHIRQGSSLVNTVMMGAQYFETEHDRSENRRLGRPDMGVGHNCHIENAILDMNSRIGDNVRLSPAHKPDGYDDGVVAVRDGVLVVTKNAVIPDGTVI